MSRQLNSNRHAKYSLKFHLVVVTKYRYKCIDKKMLKELNHIFTRLLQSKNGKLLEFNGEADHIHLLLEVPPQIKLSQLVNTLKTVSSRLIKKEFKSNIEKYYTDEGFWSRSYCIVSTGGASIETIKKYIEEQGK